MTEKWPFLDESSGAKIHAFRYYGFGDAGGLAGSFEGYPTRAAAIQAIQKDHDCVIGFVPEDLGSEAITVLSGLQYVDRLRSLDPTDPDHLLIYGKWSD